MLGMETRMLGNTGLVVSRMGLGLAALGRPGYINMGHAADLHREYDVYSMEERTRAVLDVAWNAGIRYFDAARSYGLAESFLANWLASRQIETEAVTVGSKWGYSYTAGWRVDAEKHEVKDHSLDALLRQEAESRKFLGPFLRLYQVHSATLESGVLQNREVLEELAGLRERGIRIGLSVSGPRQCEVLERALDIVISGKRLFECVQATWNLLDQSAGPALAHAHSASVGVIVKEALANGRLAGGNDDLAFADKRNALETEAARLLTTPDALALAAVLAQPWVDVVLSGAATPQQLSSNLNSLAVKWNHQASEKLQNLGEDPESYWKTRSRLPWN
jgi:aryl-alcohol dehydrogenase-like predicted oxidoreductase